MSNMPDYSKKLLKILSEKPAIPVESLVVDTETPNTKYAITRSLKGLREAGLVESIHSGQKDYARITPKGKAKMNSIRLEGAETLVPGTWDGLWRIIILDMPEDRKSERESLRYLLKKANFVCIKNTVWISPYPYEHLFKNIKKDLGLTTELMIIMTNNLDEDTLESFKNSFHK